LAILATVLLQLLDVLLLGVLLLGELLLDVLRGVLRGVLLGVLRGARVSHSSVCLVHEARRTTVDGGTGGHGRGRPSNYIARSQPRQPMLLPMKLMLAVLLLLLLLLLLLPVLPVASDSTPRHDKI
jgi:hypothetical protein